MQTTPTHTLSLPQIKFINHFLYSKPHSYTNPHTLFNYIRLKPLFKSLHLDFYLIKQYTQLLYKQQLSTYIAKLKNNGKSPVPAPSPRQLPAPAPASPYKPRRFKKFTNFLKKTFKKKSVAPLPPPPPPKLSTPSPVNPNTHLYLPAPGYKAPHQSPIGKPRFSKSVGRARLSVRSSSSSSSTPQRRLLNSSSSSNRSVSVTGYRNRHGYRKTKKT